MLEYWFRNDNYEDIWIVIKAWTLEDAISSLRMITKNFSDKYVLCPHSS